MEDVSLPKSTKNNHLTKEKFDKLLFVLDTDRSVAADRYEHLRQAMITFFSFRGAADPDELADETMNRVASRLYDGAEIFSQNPSSYFYGFARNIWRETLAKNIKVQPLEEEISEHQTFSPNPHEMLERQEAQRQNEIRLAQLQHCLAELPDQDRQLMVEYYQKAGGAKIENRQVLATRYGISLKTLRNKTSLLRNKLAACVKAKLNAAN